MLRRCVPGMLLACLALAACDSDRESTADEIASTAGDSLRALGDSAYTNGEFDTAQELFESMLGNARSIGDSSSAADAVTWLALISWRLGDYENTRRLGEESLQMKLRQGLEADLFRSYNLLGLLAWNESRPLDAIEHFDKASAAAHAAQDSANLAKVWNNLGLVATSLGQYTQARSSFTSAREAARKLGEPLIEGRTLINLGMLDLEIGDPLASIASLQDSEPLLAAAEDVVGEQVLLSLLGSAYVAIGDPGRAMAYLDEALKRARENDLRQEEAINLEQLAELQRNAGNFRRALQFFSEARTINEEMGLVDEMAMDLRSEAHILAELGNLEQALANAREALRMHRDIPSPLQEVSDLILLADLGELADQLDAAAVYVQQADSVAQRIGARSAKISVALGRARLAKRTAEPRKVLAVLAAAADDLLRGGYTVQWEADALRAWAYAEVGELEAAMTAGRKAIEEVERVRRSFDPSAMTGSYLQSRERAYSDQVMVLLRMGRPDEAFQVADGARGRVLLEQLLTAGRDQPEPEAAVRRLSAGEELLHRIDDLVDLIDEIDWLPPEERTDEIDRQADLLYGELERARLEYAAIMVRARQRDPTRLALLGAMPVSRGEVSRALELDQALLEYLITPDSVLLFVVTRDAVVHFSEAIPRDVLASRVRVVRSLLGRPELASGAGRQALTRLFDVLVRPAVQAGALQGVKRIVIVPHAELSYLPFTALLDEASGQYLVERYDITHLPSAASLPALWNRLEISGIDGLGDPLGLAPFPEQLPATIGEMESFDRMLPGARTYRGRRATESRLRQALIESSVVHVATHGILNARNPMFSRIELTAGSNSEGADNDGRFEVHELMSVAINSPLVFLSGCETGLGAGWSTSFAPGEDYSTLAQAFLYAGATTVIATLWPVRDDGAAVFARHFYQGLATGAPGYAFARAQRMMITDSRYSAPYYWAAYRLSGLGNGLAGPQEVGQVSVQSTDTVKLLVGARR